MKLWKKNLLIGFIFFLTLFVYAGYKLFWGVIKPVRINDSDLVVQLTQVPDRDNGFEEIMKLPPMAWTDADKRKTQRWLSAEEWNQEEIDRLLSQNESIFLVVREALKKPYFQNTNIPAWYDSSQKVEIFSILKIMMIRTHSMQKTGDPELIRTVLEEQLVFSDRLIDSQGTLVEFMTGLAGRTWSLKVISERLKTDNITKDEISHYEALLKDSPNVIEGLITGIKIEYISAKKSLPSLQIWWSDRYKKHPKGLISDLVAAPNYDRPETIRLFYNRYKEIISFLKYPFSDNLFSEEKLFYEEQKKQEHVPGNIVGKLLLRIGFPGYSNAFRHCARCDALAGCVQVQVAVKKYFRDKGVLPSTLEVLIPEYLPGIPEDTFSGGTLKYSAQAGCVFATKSKDYGTEPEWIKKEAPVYVFFSQEADGN
jgi:hypothetical protein